ncbi:DUF4365 domain-containing protein [Burkholderia vietnamiensis]|uniref:DUF4365 domain-containing protein n=1 Tax=Burkholderia vietnamiensis (strain G4 / LMG 22486) TaxID=269482 RepID=A4JFE1_BURVG|nr:hypothetical protein Bcep1808_1991 [Burkholderia vietnamiensis G4]MCB4344752.1 DUF4365 domain-containing protein [Burkholderia vietnamiensis]
MKDFEENWDSMLTADLPLPQRPKSHISESESGKIFGRLLSPDWIIRDVPPPDYGVDCELELAPKNRVTGQKTLIQLKAMASIPWNKDQSFSFSGVKPTTSAYWHQCDLPVFLVLVDLAEERAFYSPAKSYIRTQFKALLDQKPITYRFQAFREIKTPHEHWPFLGAFFRERMLGERDRALAELPDFQRRFFEFHLRNAWRANSMVVEGDERPRALFDLLQATESLANRLDETMHLYTVDRELFKRWKETRVAPTPMTEGDMTQWLEQIDRTLTRLVRRARALVLKFEKDYWARQDPSLVERIGALSIQSAADNNRSAYRLSPRW